MGVKYYRDTVYNVSLVMQDKAGRRRWEGVDSIRWVWLGE